MQQDHKKIKRNQHMKVGRESDGPFSLYAGLTIGAVLVFFILMLVLKMHSRDNNDIYLAQLDLLQTIRDHKNSDDLTVIMMGNSRLRHASTFGFDPNEEIINLPDGRRIFALQFAEDVAMFSSYKDIWLHILASKPDILIVQDMLFTTARRTEAMSLKAVSKVIYDYYDMIRQGMEPLDEWNRERNHIIDEMCVKDFNRQAMQDRIIFGAYRDNHSLTDNDNTVAMRGAISQALDAGIKVMIMRLPTNEKAIAKFGIEPHVVDYFGLGFIPSKQQLLPDLKDKVTWLEYPAPGTEQFCDFSHLNEQGRDNYSDWLLRQL